MAAFEGICPSPNGLMDNRTIQSSLNEVCSGPVFPCLCSSSHMPLTDGPTWPPWHDKRPPLWGNGFAVCRSPQQLCLFFSSPGSLSPACPSSPLLFTHRQLSPFPNAVIPSNILCSCFLLFSCSLAFLPRSLLLAGLFLGWGGRGWGRNREEKKNQWGGGGYICSFMTNHMCFWVFVFTCFSWKRGWWKGMTGEERQPYGSCLLNSESDCLFPAMSRGKYVLLITFKYDSSPGSG